MSKPQLKPTGEGEVGAGASWPMPGSAHKSGQQYVEIQRMPTAGNCWRRPACLAACLLVSPAPCYNACSTRLELDTCACLHCRVYCTTIYKPLHRPGQEASIWPTNARHGAWVRCNPSIPLLSEFPIDFSACSVGMWSPDWHETSPHSVKGFSVFILGHYQ